MILAGLRELGDSILQGIGVCVDATQARLWMGRPKDGTAEPDLPETP